MSIPAEYWVVINHDSWEEAILVHGNTPQEAEDNAARVMLEESAEYRPEGESDAEWLTQLLENPSWSVMNASYRKV